MCVDMIVVLLRYKYSAKFNDQMTADKTEELSYRMSVIRYGNLQIHPAAKFVYQRETVTISQHQQGSLHLVTINTLLEYFSELVLERAVAFKDLLHDHLFSC